MIRSKVTVAIPSYNSELFLIKTVESILSQNKTVDEIIIIDDCSTDKTYEIACELSERYTNLKAYRNANNLGYARNWNRCFELSNSDYLLILHSDDVLKKNIIEKQVEYIKHNSDLAIVGGQEDIIDENGEIINLSVEKQDRIFNKGEIYEFIASQYSYIPCSSVMFNMEKIKTIGYFQENVLATDELYWPKVLSCCPIAILGTALINRRKHNNQAEFIDFKEKKKDVVGWGKHFKMVVEYEKRPDKKRLLSNLIKSKLGYSAISISRSVIIHHHSLKLASYYIINSIKYYPAILLTKRFWKSIAYIVLLYLGLTKNK